MASFEQLIDRASDPSTPTPNWQAIKEFIQAMLRDDTGPKDAAFMLLDKIRSPKLNTAMRALVVLEAIVQAGGPRVHTVIGKFKFLNECIKMVSPKYHENRPQPVIQKVLYLIGVWARNIPDEPKTKEVYNMLKKQGMRFPEEVPDMVGNNLPLGQGFLGVAESASERESPLEQDERQSKLLAKLLKSKDPNDLRKANKLIQKMVKRDRQKQEEMSTVRQELNMVQDNTKLLSDMLAACNGPVQQDEVIQQLHSSCQEARPKLVRMAGEVTDQDLLGEVLAAGDDITRVLDQYNAKLTSASTAGGLTSPTADVSMLGDSLMDLDFGQPQQQQQAPVQQQQQQQSSFDPFGSLGSQPAVSQPSQPASGFDAFASLSNNGGSAPAQPTPSLFDAPVTQAPPAATQAPTQPADPFAALASLGGAPTAAATTTPSQQPQQQQAASDPFASLSSLGASASTSASNGLDDLLGGSMTSPPVSAPAAPSLGFDFSAPAPAAAPSTPLDMNTVNVSLESVQPSSTPPVTLFDANGFKVMLHFAANRVHPDAVSTVVSFLNFNSSSVDNIMFQAAVPKALQVKLMPATSASAPAMGPTGQPAAVTQVMVIGNPQKLAIKLRFKLTYTLNGATQEHMGDCSSFPLV
eukprot:TRINITY_DN11233_c0_g2_i1.p1 TRINITY_DN11233_c0_g2~~TRINITY_DN11233_c0_g2_i1.p1  ORF type:complete len:636 (+),score=158.77 TRINITY_DN11233_c0_g2_i1:2102-4009(+)